MIFKTSYGIILGRTKDGKLERNKDFHAPFHGFSFSQELPNGSRFFSPTSFLEGHGEPIESVIIPRKISHVWPGIGHLHFSNASGRLYILCETQPDDWAVCYVLKSLKDDLQPGNIHKIKVSCLELAPPGFEFEFRNEYFQK